MISRKLYVSYICLQSTVFCLVLHVFSVELNCVFSTSVHNTAQSSRSVLTIIFLWCTIFKVCDCPHNHMIIFEVFTQRSQILLCVLFLFKWSQMIVCVVTLYVFYICLQSIVFGAQCARFVHAGSSISHTIITELKWWLYKSSNKYRKLFYALLFVLFFLRRSSMLLNCMFPKSVYNQLYWAHDFQDLFMSDVRFSIQSS